jgi:ATP-dependent helicase/nuclease subunit A
MTATPADQGARDRIRTDLATNMLVEAGAGSGKTTSLVDRMLEHVRTGTPVERLTAVTFTRKAANELRERFQVRLERAIREASESGADASRYETALRELDRAFLGTIHSFCARLLRERPLEVGLDPGFQEITEEEWEDARLRFWRRWVERVRRDDPALLAGLQEVGVEPWMLYDGFKVVMTYPDVGFPVGAAARPDTAS